MRRVTPAIAIVALAAPVDAQAPEFGREFPLVLESVEVVGAAQDLGVLVDSELGPDGSVYVADMSNIDEQPVCDCRIVFEHVTTIVRG